MRIIFFVLSSLFVVLVSWRTLHNPNSHGFYRFFAFEGILVLLFLNIPYWIRDPFSPLQILSWILLFGSIPFVFQGFILLGKRGNANINGKREENFNFENTTRLVTTGIYKYIRHPLYSSLLLLAWGAYLKHISLIATLVILLTTLCLVLTAKMEERENIAYFGESYLEYIKKSRMFIPFIF
ncbi:isoprenylcysteine carboxylmethyltransferase family protein [candidate division KSB1 bacterium]|nr:isoprenylcysteine carboxylmethyltransferase family protein [candidate division KSB1 bacterium]